MITYGLSVAVLARDLLGGPKGPPMGGGVGLRSTPQEIVSKNKAFVAVAILGAPHRWGAGKSLIRDLQTVQCALVRGRFGSRPQNAPALVDPPFQFLLPPAPHNSGPGPLRNGHLAWTMVQATTHSKLFRINMISVRI